MVMKTKITLIFVFIGVLAGIVLLVFPYFFQKEETLKYNFLKGSQMSYSYSMISELKYGNQKEMLPFKVKIKGTLNTKVINANNDKNTLVFGFSPDEIDYGQEPNMHERLSVQFAVVMNNNGRFHKFIFPDGLDAKTKGFLKSMIYPMEIILKDTDNKQYIQHESDGLGRYIALYQRENNSLNKTKERYVDTKASNLDTSSVNIKKSDYNIKIVDNSGWIENLFGNEHVKITYSKMYEINSILNVKIVKLNSVAKKSDVWDITSVSEIQKPVSFDENDTTAKEDQHKKPKKLQRIQNTSKKQAGKKSDEFYKYLEKTRADELNMNELAEYMKNNPEIIESAFNIIRNNNISDNKISLLIASMGIAGTDKAQEVLLQIARDQTFSENNRFRAVMGFSQLTRPPKEEVISYLLSGTNKLGQYSDNSDIASSSVLVAGAIVDNIYEQYNENALNLNNRLINRLKSSYDTYQQSTLLLSLGNTKITSNAEVISDYLNSTDEKIRSAAAQALETTPGEKSKNIIIEQLKKESSPDVSVKLLDSLNNKSLDAENLKEVGNILLNSKNNDVRRVAINIMTEHKQNAPDLVNNTFKEALKNEKSEINAKNMLKGYAK